METKHESGEESPREEHDEERAYTENWRKERLLARDTENHEIPRGS